MLGDHGDEGCLSCDASIRRWVRLIGLAFPLSLTCSLTRDDLGSIYFYLYIVYMFLVALCSRVSFHPGSFEKLHYFTLQVVCLFAGFFTRSINRFFNISLED